MPTLEFLKKGFSTGKAFVLKTNALGADLLIPVRRKKNNYLAEEYTFILIQVKNYSAKLVNTTERFRKAYVEKLKPSCAFLNSSLETFSNAYLGISIGLFFNMYFQL